MALRRLTYLFTSIIFDGIALANRFFWKTIMDNDPRWEVSEGRRKENITEQWDTSYYMDFLITATTIIFFKGFKKLK